jgi:plasmid stabilization system protein ParE
MRLEVLGEAEEEAARESEFYEGRGPGQGLDFLEDLRLVFERIVDGPAHHAQVRKRANLRVALFQRFPFKVVFEVDAERVRVIAVCHQKRRARYWRGRT